ncbi:MAG: hypothetical protein KDC66_00520 [Phaeodactylibacter sp.]|nr:hypothetical protein [Phaeodactylibacter sp.]MCB9276725.1 hypothetical protein [Lewinellaceae bacterium]
MDWTYRNIAELAPNNLVLEKARALSSARHWEELAGDGNLLWGACRSSGGHTYHVVASLAGDAFRCDCKGRYMPCRHILALLFRFVKAGEPIPTVESAPSWARELLRQPVRAVISPEAKAQREADSLRRFGQRLALMQQGVKDLEQWLLDLVQQGLSTAENQPEAFWDSFAARMVDAKLGGIARRIRAFKSAMADEQWHSRLLGEIGALYLFVQGFKQLDELPGPMQDELLALAGVNHKKEALLQQSGLSDNWLVIGQLEGDSEDDKLRYRRTWLWGEQSRRHALLLDYAWGRQGYEAHWPIGSMLRGEAIYYPAAYPLRALVRKAAPYHATVPRLAGYPSLAAFADAYAAALAANPWLQVFPCLLDGVVPFRKSGRWWVQGPGSYTLPLADSGDTAWKLLALSGGRPVQAFGEWNGESLLPLSIVSDGSVVPLTGTTSILEGVLPGQF